jgi:hypothetical protein
MLNHPGSQGIIGTQLASLGMAGVLANSFKPPKMFAPESMYKGLIGTQLATAGVLASSFKPPKMFDTHAACKGLIGTQLASLGTAGVYANSFKRPKMFDTHAAYKSLIGTHLASLGTAGVLAGPLDEGAPATVDPAILRVARWYCRLPQHQREEVLNKLLWNIVHICGLVYYFMPDSDIPQSPVVLLLGLMSFVVTFRELLSAIEATLD